MMCLTVKKKPIPETEDKNEWTNRVSTPSAPSAWARFLKSRLRNKNIFVERQFKHICYQNIKRKTVIYFYNEFTSLRLSLWQCWVSDQAKSPLLLFFGFFFLHFTWIVMYERIIWNFFKHHQISKIIITLWKVYILYDLHL